VANSWLVSGEGKEYDSAQSKKDCADRSVMGSDWHRPGMLSASEAAVVAVNALPKEPYWLPVLRVFAYILAGPRVSWICVLISSKIAGMAGMCHLTCSERGVGITTPLVVMIGVSGRAGETFPNKLESIADELNDLKIGTRGPGMRILPSGYMVSKVFKSWRVLKPRIPAERMARRV